MEPQKVFTPLGVTNYRNEKKRFGIKDADRLMHMYLLGKSGSGKSTLILNMTISDLQRGHGFALLDPHGELSKELLHYVPKERLKDVIYFNPIDIDNPIAFNPLAGIQQRHHNLVASGIISTMKKVWADSWGPRMEHILRYSLLSLLQFPGATLLDIQPLLTDNDFRSQVLCYITDIPIRNFWHSEFASYTKALRAEAIAPILNKVGIFAASLPLRHCLGQKDRGLRMWEIMNSRKVLIVNLSKGELGEDTSALLGSMLITAIQLAALYRTKLSPEKRGPFFLYIDEMQSYVTMSFCDILAEARKYGLGLFLTHQYLEQIDHRILS
ncbi:MAG TPA: type IV secretion system DNA-binding domain-containing protein, partial [Flavipsychrobacter sp.]|nr:type IV secretion system DNA-binding domain-containing protein [Flavipsychrobacter sp.]